jgi:hypothetical protein
MANVYVRSGAAGAGTGADWANAYTTLSAALTAKAAGDSFWVSEDHSESTAGAVTLTSPGTAASPCFIYCVNHLGSVPPVSADLRTTAIVATSGNFGQTHLAFAYYYGIIFNIGTGGNNQILALGNAGANWLYYKNCAIAKLATNAGNSVILVGAAGIRTKVVFDNTTVQWGSAAEPIAFRSCEFVWKNTPSAIQGATLPTTLFGANTPSNANVILEGVDLSALGSGKTLVGAIGSPQRFYFKDCKFGASVTVATTPAGPSEAETYVTRSDSGATNYRSEKIHLYGR